jgi:hypothetical protein
VSVSNVWSICPLDKVLILPLHLNDWVPGGVVARVALVWKMDNNNEDDVSVATRGVVYRPYPSRAAHRSTTIMTCNLYTC